jgi:hypothetical protein
MPRILPICLRLIDIIHLNIELVGLIGLMGLKVPIGLMS